jgi:hypothetical protein
MFRDVVAKIFEDIHAFNYFVIYLFWIMDYGMNEWQA